MSVTYAKNVASLNIRGTTNNWGTTPMSLVGITSGRPASPSPAAVMGTVASASSSTSRGLDPELRRHQQGWRGRAGRADITTAVVGAYVVRFNDQTLAYSPSAQ